MRPNDTDGSSTVDTTAPRLVNLEAGTRAFLQTLGMSAMARRFLRARTRGN